MTSRSVQASFAPFANNPNPEKVTIILIYKMTELNHKMIRGPIILIILIKPMPVQISANEIIWTPGIQI